MSDLPESGRDQTPRAHASILLIDRDAAQRDATLAVLRQQGFRADGSASVSDALSELARGALPDVIVLDLLVSDIDGWELRASLLAQPSWAQIPLVALTGEDSAKARAIHASAFLTKPFAAELLIETIQRVLQIADGAPTPALGAERQGAPLAANIAHEVNNSLAYVLGTLELAESKARELEGRLRGAEAFSMVGLRQLIARAQRGADRIVAAVRELEKPKRAGDSLRPRELLDAGRPWSDPLYTRERSHPAEAAFLRKSKPRRSVLVVDDEAMICELVNDLLEEEYDVVSFTDPRAALASILSGSFDVIVCDLLMPELTGMDLYEQLAKQRPELTQRLIFLSGGGFTDDCREFLARVRRPQVKKPFHHFELLDAIEEQLTPKH